MIGLKQFSKNRTWYPWVLCGLMWQLAGCGSSTSQTSDGRSGAEGSAVDNTEPIVNPRDIKLEGRQAVKLTVHTNPSGCMVFVDLVPVHNENDAAVMTPCEFMVPRGSHVLSIERPGGRRVIQQVEADIDRELEIDVTGSPGKLDEPSLLNGPLFEAAIGRSIPLASLNSPDRELDPFLSPDARTITFSSDRGAMKGVYMASRPSPYHDFDEPKLVVASSGADLPVSPSVSSDGLIMIYAVPEKSRLWQLTRANIEAPFDNKEITRTDDKGERAWTSSQLSADGLRLYWTEASDTAILTRAAVRSAPDKMFGKTLAFELPGYHPHLSSDGLRQFLFDGTTLKRARRGSIRQPFGAPEVVMEVQPEGYSESAQHRQFWVTDDEQWLFYSSNTNSKGDLFVIRLSDGPGWGRLYAGKSVKSKMVTAVEPEEKPMTVVAPKETVDPRTLPLPYTTHWAAFVKLLEANKGEEALALVNKADRDPKFKGDHELLGWDRELAEALVQLHRDVQEGLQSLKSGAVVRIAGTRFEFDRLDGQTLHVKLKDKELMRTLENFTPGERITLADSGPEKADAAKAFRFAVYLYFQGKIFQPVADGWFKKTGDAAAKFQDRFVARVLHQGKGELARGNIAAAMSYLDSVSAAAPNSDFAAQAFKLRETLYDSLDWKPVGDRKWNRGEQGEYAVAPPRSNGSYLKSDQSYGDFELTCEWKVTEPGAMGGVFLRYSGNGKPLENGAKIHLANDPDLKKMDRFASGALFATKAPSQNASLPAGQWNTLKIQARGAEVKAWINDKEVLQATLEKGVPASGFVMLDGVVGGINYRKVLVYELPQTSSE